MQQQPETGGSFELTEADPTQLLPLDIEARRAAVMQGAPLATLADSLAEDLAPLLDAPLPISERKARLTRAGGRCAVHGTYLEFDPWSPHTHRCAQCDRLYQGDEHDAWWAMGASLWTMERAVHAAALFLLRGDPRHGQLSARILGAFAERYDAWPNSDNVLGPSRPFFSTYLESIWLLNACHALDLLEAANVLTPPELTALGRRVRKSLIAPSAALIAGFHEGTSNRQVWNEVAVLSSMQLLGDEQALLERLDADGGLPWLMEKGLLDDGTWFEGENYHLFAHRGLWYGRQLLEARAMRAEEPIELAPELEERYTAGFVAPFLGVLPDGTLPSRRDTQYGISLQQWRMAEYCELGYAHHADPQLAGLLTTMYGSSDPAGEPGGAARRERARSTADAERNAPAAPLSRANMSWRGLLGASIDGAPRSDWEPGSILQASQGLAVLRRDRGRTYVALEGGHTGGGHGHPDRLALTLQTGSERWLQDPGTGSYVDPSLHWYRSTLAHAAPLVDGASQLPVAATLVAFEDRGGAGWVSKRVSGIADGVSIDRTVVVCDGYLVDLLEWRADSVREISLPIARAATLSESASACDSPWQPAVIPGAGGLEDGFDFLESIEQRRVRRDATIELSALPLTSGNTASAAALYYTVRTDDAAGVTLTRAQTPGAPGSPNEQRHWLSARGRSGQIIGVWAWPAGTEKTSHVQSVQLGRADGIVATVTTADGTVATHSRVAHGWHIELEAGGARSSVDLEGLVVAADPNAGDLTAADAPLMEVDFEIPLVNDEDIEGEPGDEIVDSLLVPMGSNNYIGTELPWSDAGEPTAMLQLARTETHLVADLAISTGPLVTQSVAADGSLHNPLDNERPDVNSDGIQWYMGAPDSGKWTAAALSVPDVNGAPGSLRTHVPPTLKAAGHAAEWKPTDDGWAVRVTWPLDELPVDADGCIAFDLIVNERPPERERRRGQLALSGGGGFGYLRGDRQEPSRALVIAVT